jgi:hypothetical protein
MAGNGFWDESNLLDPQLSIWLDLPGLLGQHAESGLSWCSSVPDCPATPFAFAFEADELAAIAPADSLRTVSGTSRTCSTRS